MWQVWQVSGVYDIHGAVTVLHSVFKWNRHYYVQTTCCNALYELDPEIGRRIARGEDVEILPQHLQRVNPQYGYGFENGSGNTIKDATIVDIQLQRTSNSVPNAAGSCKN